MPGQLSYGVDGLSAQLAELAPIEGANAGSWPGLVTHRLSSPIVWMRDQIRFLSLVLVVQGRHQLTVDRTALAQGPYQSMVLRGHVPLDVEVLEASFGRPYLSVVLEIDPRLVRRVASEMAESDNKGPRTNRRSRLSQRRCERELLAVVIRAGSSITSDMDRSLLAPLYQQEIVYWLLKSEQGEHVRALAAADCADQVVFTAIDYARAHLTEPLSVSELAGLVNLSTSAFAHRFRDVTGCPPYQFFKEMRLNHARELLTGDDLTVRQIARQAGYSGVPQFTSAFRNRFGVTPTSVRHAS